MSHLNSNVFKLSFLAAAVLSLSACSTAPKIAGVDLGEVGAGLSEMGSSAWEGTKNLLHIGPTEPELLDEVDLALMEDDANMEAIQLAANDNEPVLPLDDTPATMTDLISNEPLLPQDYAKQQNKPAFGQIPDQPAVAGSTLVLGDTATQQPATTLQQQLLEDEALAAGTELLSTKGAAPVETVASNDMTHVVGENETLWVIAKRTTGDANNWHVIADINNLAPNAAVFVGQKLVIPADMVKPSEAVAAESIAVVQVEEPAIVALNIPAKKTAEPQIEEAVVAAAEQIKTTAPADAGNIMADATALKVGNGETLWDFAKRTTGDATNWKLIADKNLFDEKQLASIRPGQKIYVPTDMVRSRDASGALIAKGAEGTVPTAVIGGALPQNKEAIDATAAVLAGTNQPEGKVKIVEAAYQDSDGITPVTAESLSKEAAIAVAENDDKLGKVMVSGTYYPKAVYNQADFSSSLLMRVSPGTQLLVSKAIGPWLEVKTDKGVGYVHSRDIK